MRFHWQFIASNPGYYETADMRRRFDLSSPQNLTVFSWNFHLLGCIHSAKPDEIDFRTRLAQDMF
jgi:hypothetical protein